MSCGVQIDPDDKSRTATLLFFWLPSREPTKPTLGKEIIFKSALGWERVVPRRVKLDLKNC